MRLTRRSLGPALGLLALVALASLALVWVRVPHHGTHGPRMAAEAILIARNHNLDPQDKAETHGDIGAASREEELQRQEEANRLAKLAESPLGQLFKEHAPPVDEEEKEEGDEDEAILEGDGSPAHTNRLRNHANADDIKRLPPPVPDMKSLYDPANVLEEFVEATEDSKEGAGGAAKRQQDIADAPAEPAPVVAGGSIDSGNPSNAKKPSNSNPQAGSPSFEKEERRQAVMDVVATDDDKEGDESDNATDINQELLRAHRGKSLSDLHILSALDRNPRSVLQVAERLKPMDPDFEPALPFPHHHTPEARGSVMVALITGGPKNTTIANREAVVDTWADQDTYFVTHEPMKTKNIIWLPDIAELGGSALLGRKVLIMWYHIWLQYGEEYDWFIKADDDTYLNLARIKNDLLFLNPDVPIYLGAKRYGAAAKGTIGPGYLWEEKGYIMFCHGGAGYIISRGLLRHLAENIQQCLIKKPHLSLEDARMASCIYQHTGVDCIDFSTMEFGALDFFRNRHDQNKHEAQIRDFTSSEERLAILLSRSSFHSVTSKTTHALHSIMSSNTPLLDSTLSMIKASVASALKQRRHAYTAAFNCSAKSADLEADDLTPAAAICHSSMLKDIPILSLDRAILQNYNRTWGAVLENADIAQPEQKHAGQHSARTFLQSTLQANTLQEHTGPFSPLLKSANPEKSHLNKLQNALSKSALGDSRRHVVLVYAGAAGASSEIYLRRLVHSLRAVGSAAHVAVFATVGGDMNSLRSFVASTPGSSLNVLHPTQTGGIASEDLSDDLLMAYAAFSNYLLVNADKFTMSALVRPQTLFQRDPFATIETYSGVAFFATNPLKFWFTTECRLPKIHQLVRVLSIDPLFSIGLASAHRQVFARLLFIRKIYSGATQPSCTPDIFLSEAVWYKQLAVSVETLVIYGPTDGPVLQLSEEAESLGSLHSALRFSTRTSQSLSGLKNVLVVNSKNAAVAVVLDYDTIIEGGGGGSNANFGVLRAVKASKPDEQASRDASKAAAAPPIIDHVQRAIVELIRRNSSNPNMRASEVWISTDPAAAHFKAMFAMYENDVLPFLVVESVLEKHTRFRHDPSLPMTLRIGSPKTHKTGSSTLSSIFFRAGARYNVRIFHRGNMAFLPPYTMAKGINDPSLRHAYDMDFHHLSPNGRWKGTFSTAVAWYRHLIGDDVSMFTLFREPKQQYVSWAYYYFIPNRYPADPMTTFLDFLGMQRNANPLAGEFGLYTEEDVESFMTKYLGEFRLILLSERFDECLVLLRRMLNWDLLDVTYMKILDSSKEGSKRWDNKPLVPTPKLATLPDNVVAQIANITQLDAKLYSAAAKRLDALIAEQDSTFGEEVLALKELQRTIEDVCKANPKHAFCIWYQLEDVQYLSLVSHAGFTPMVGFEGIKPPL